MLRHLFERDLVNHRTGGGAIGAPDCNRDRAIRITFLGERHALDIALAGQQGKIATQGQIIHRNLLDAIIAAALEETEMHLVFFVGQQGIKAIAHGRAGLVLAQTLIGKFAPRRLAHPIQPTVRTCPGRIG